jgi:hypothetical protein
MPLYTVLTGTVAHGLGFTNALPTQSGANPSGSTPGGNSCAWTNAQSVHDPVVTGLSGATAGDALGASTFADKWAENDFTATSSAPPGSSGCFATIPANAATGSSWANGAYVLVSLSNAGASPAQLAALSASLGQTITEVYSVVTLNTVWWDYNDNTGHQTGSVFNRTSGLLYGTNTGASCNDGLETYNEAEVDSVSGGGSNDPQIYLAYAGTLPPPPYISGPPLPVAIGGSGWGRGTLAIYPAGGPPGAFAPEPVIEPIPPGPPVVALLCIPCCQLVFGYAI